MTTIEILRGSGGPAVAIVIAATVSKQSAGRKTSFDFTDGAAWLAGALIHNGLPNDGFVDVAPTKPPPRHNNALIRPALAIDAPHL